MTPVKTTACEANCTQGVFHLNKGLMRQMFRRKKYVAGFWN